MDGFIMENLIKTDDLGVPLFLETPNSILILTSQEELTRWIGKLKQLPLGLRFNGFFRWVVGVFCQDIQTLH